MSDPEQFPRPPPVVQVSPTEIAGDWPNELRRKLAEQGLEPAAVARVAEAVARLAPSLVGDPSKLRAAARLHLLLAGLTLAGAVGGGILNYLLSTSAAAYLVVGGAAIWGGILLSRGLAQWRLSRRCQD
jgi:hypothetical protein